MIESNSAESAKLEKGPLGLLKRCMDQHQRVKVVIRRVADIRGYCIGVLQAFDKHFNMVLTGIAKAFDVL